MIRNAAYDARATSSFCSYKASTNADRITYDKLFVETNDVTEADMDVATGTFTAGATASYQVCSCEQPKNILDFLQISANMAMNFVGGQQHSVWVVVNDQRVEETRISSSYDKSMTGIMTDNGSKNILLLLNRGDKVYLAHDTDEDQPVTNVTFCISLIKIN